MNLSLQNLPKVDDIMGHEQIEAFKHAIAPSRYKKIIQDAIDQKRQDILNNDLQVLNREEMTTEILAHVLETYTNETREALKEVINATGIIIHTNLGRAPLSKKTADHVAKIATSYNNLEYSVVTGQRRNRLLYIEKMIADLTGAEAAILVNNNAAAVFLTLNTLAAGKEVILSRGEMVEIGESFRISEIIEKSGCITKEVGTTNKTREKDYENAITDATSILLKVHTSNYKVVGFTESIAPSALDALAKKHDLITMEDMGSGILLDLSRYGLPKERTIKEALDDNMDIITFSGDKMLGGPQSGFICGKKKYIEAIKKNQLLRCMRLDKMSLAAIESVLSDYFTDNFKTIPIYEKMLFTMETLKEKAALLLEKLPTSKYISFRIGDHKAQFGGGSLPDQTIDSLAIYAKGFVAPQVLASYLREYITPIVVISLDDEIVLDLRTLETENFDIIAKAFKAIIDHLQTK